MPKVLKSSYAFTYAIDYFYFVMSVFMDKNPFFTSSGLSFRAL